MLFTRGPHPEPARERRVEGRTVALQSVTRTRAMNFFLRNDPNFRARARKKKADSPRKARRSFERTSRASLLRALRVFVVKSLGMPAAHSIGGEADFAKQTQFGLDSPSSVMARTRPGMTS